MRGNDKECHSSTSKGRVILARLREIFSDMTGQEGIGFDENVSITCDLLSSPP